MNRKRESLLMLISQGRHFCRCANKLTYSSAIYGGADSAVGVGRWNRAGRAVGKRWANCNQTTIKKCKEKEKRMSLVFSPAIRMLVFC